MKGMETLELLQRYQDSIEKQTKACLETQLGSRAPQIYEGLGAALKLLTELATCQWGCRGGAHTVENLVRRVCNYTSASLRLAHLGLYDEALTLVRPVSEIANLLQLFQIDSEALRRWNQLPERERRKEFGPAKIRKAIESKNQTPIVGSDAYSKLSEIGIHATPSSIRQSHDIDHQVYLGGEFSVPGFLLVLNQLAHLVSPILPVAGMCADAPTEKQICLNHESVALMGAASFLDITNYNEFFEGIRSKQLKDDALDELQSLSKKQFQRLVKKVENELTSRSELSKSIDEMSEQEIQELIYPEIARNLARSARSKQN